MSETVKVDLQARPHRYEINVGDNLLKDCGSWAKACLPAAARKIAVISNSTVFGLYGETVVAGLESAGFDVSVWKMGDGERYKNLRSFEKALEFFSSCRLKRTDAVIALGGGVVGDLTGFAASAYLRGIAFLQIPTTLLSMIDSSVGGKTGVNSTFGKNLIGAFHQPAGVLIDIETLKTLPRREITAGFAEAVKQGAIAGRELFDRTSDFLAAYPPARLKTFFSDDVFLNLAAKLVASQVGFKAAIVGGDELEDPGRCDAKSRKILNFGHTVAHALEKITNYRYFKHGEAVAYGVLAAGEISKHVANLDQNDLKSLNDVVGMTGRLPIIKNIETDEIIEAFAFDKKNVGDSLQWILLEEIGKPKILSNKDVPTSVIRQSIQKIFED